MADIGIVGYGRVGRAVAYGLGKANNILAYDKFPEDPKEVTSLESVVENSEFIFVSLPTPYKETEGKTPEFDLSIMDENMNQITRVTDGTDKVVLIKSTVIPGTTRAYAKKYPRTHFCSNPEFLTEENYLADFSNADRHVIGCDKSDISLRVTHLYRKRFAETPILRVNPSSSETGKYACNLFLAMKVIFANVMYSACEKDGADWEDVRAIMVSDHRIGDSHLHVTPERGFGGKCFPKDILAFIYHMRKQGLDASLFEEVWEINLRMRQNRDWEDIPWVRS